MGKKSRRPSGKQTRRNPIVASSISAPHPDATVGPEASFESTRPAWQGSDTTSVPPIGEPDDERSVENPSDFAQKYLRGGISFQPRAALHVLVILWIAWLGWLFLQDNGAGKVDTWEGKVSFLWKAGFTLLFVLLAVFLVWAINRFHRWRAERGHT